MFIMEVQEINYNNMLGCILTNLGRYDLHEQRP